MIRATYAYDLTAARQFAAEHAPELDLSELGRCGTALEVRDGNALAGLMVFAWTDETTMQLHVVLAPEIRGRWRRQPLQDMHNWPRLLGASRLVTKAATPAVAGILRRLGWRQSGDTWCCEL